VGKNKEDKGMNSEQMYHNNVLQEWYDDNNTNEKIHICLEELLKHHMHRKKHVLNKKSINVLSQMVNNRLGPPGHEYAFF